MIALPTLHPSDTQFGLKDIYDAKGLPTAPELTSKRKKSPPKLPSIEKFLQLGAVQESQFAHGARPREFRDVSYSQEDGYLATSASNSGSACAIAAYKWLEFTVGSDTRSSVRKSVALVGAYGVSPSLGSMDLRGVVPLSQEMDFFARHSKVVHEVASNW